MVPTLPYFWATLASYLVGALVLCLKQVLCWSNLWKLLTEDTVRANNGKRKDSFCRPPDRYAEYHIFINDFSEIVWSCSLTVKGHSSLLSVASIPLFLVWKISSVTIPSIQIHVLWSVSNNNYLLFEAKIISSTYMYISLSMAIPVITKNMSWSGNLYFTQIL